MAELFNLTGLREAITIPDQIVQLNSITEGSLFVTVLIGIFFLLALAINNATGDLKTAILGSSTICMVLSLLLIYYAGVGTLGYGIFVLFLVVMIGSGLTKVISD